MIGNTLMPETVMGIPVAQVAESPSTSAGVLKRLGTSMTNIFSSPQPTAEGRVNVLQQKFGQPAGLANEVSTSLASTPIRLWIVDNSFSMSASDGARVVPAYQRGGGLTSQRCTRTAELTDAVIMQAEMSASLEARTDFLHLNMPRGGAPKRVSLISGADPSGAYRDGGATVSTSTAAADLLRRSIQPCGRTPLTDAINEVHALLAPVAMSMRQSGTIAVVVIATDGLPDHPPSFLQALSLLQVRCPVWVIVRLCTSEASIVEYWSELDKDLEAPLDILDDVFGEAEEVGRHNDWLTYAPSLHAARLFGVQHKAFDTLDERPMAPSEVRQFCELLLGTTLPEPEAELDRFIGALRQALAPLPPVFEPRTRQMRPWIDVDRLSASLSMRFAQERLLRNIGLECCLGGHHRGSSVRAARKRAALHMRGRTKY